LAQPEALVADEYRDRLGLGLPVRRGGVGIASESDLSQIGFAYLDRKLNLAPAAPGAVRAHPLSGRRRHRGSSYAHSSRSLRRHDLLYPFKIVERRGSSGSLATLPAMVVLAQQLSSSTSRAFVASPAHHFW
jgi:hypothetical protein